MDYKSLGAEIMTLQTQEMLLKTCNSSTAEVSSFGPKEVMDEKPYLSKLLEGTAWYKYTELETKTKQAWYINIYQ